jgi:uncharacterized membrane protein YphA (DoxX/SURF4 family)
MRTSEAQAKRPVAALDRARLQLRGKRWANLFVIYLRLGIGFGFLPAGLKKVSGQPFADPDKVGVFYDFVHAFYATGPFYYFVGSLQLFGAALLMTQRWATLGAAVVAPMITAIVVLCWSTAGVPTIITTTAMALGTWGLLVWDLDKWRGLFWDDRLRRSISTHKAAPVVDLRLWQWCGLSILGLYLLISAISGEVYRPRGAEFTNPHFYVMPGLLLLTIATWWVDRVRYLRRKATTP